MHCYTRVCVFYFLNVSKSKKGINTTTIQMISNHQYDTVPFPLQSIFTSNMGFPTYTDTSELTFTTDVTVYWGSFHNCDPNVFNQPPAYRLKIRRARLFEIMNNMSGNYLNKLDYNIRKQQLLNAGVSAYTLWFNWSFFVDPVAQNNKTETLSALFSLIYGKYKVSKCFTHLTHTRRKI